MSERVSSTADVSLEALDAELRAWLAGDRTRLADPWPMFERLRERSPVHELGPVVVLSRFAEVKMASREVNRFSSRVFVSDRVEEALSTMTPEQRADHDYVAAHDSVSVSHTDDEQHVRLRRIFHRAFTPRRVAEMKKTVAAYTDRLCDPLAGGDVVDIRELAYRLPLLIVGDLLGVPESDHDIIHEWSLKIGASRGVVDPVVLSEARVAIEAFGAYLSQLTASVRGHGGSGTIVNALLDDEEQEHLTNEELTANFVLLLFAGHETTTNLIASGLLALLEQRRQWDLLCADPAGMAPKATEELLRYVSPVQLTQRVAREDVLVDGVAVPAGRHIISLNGSANRDATVFDRPDEVDLGRDNAGHLSPGFGPHFCLGAALARLESQVIFTRLATNYPDMQLACDPGELQWGGNAMLRTLVELPVSLGTARA